MVGTQQGCELRPAHVGQHHVGDQNVDPQSCGRRDRIRAGPGDDDSPPGSFQRQTNELSHRAGVVDDENGGRVASSAARDCSSSRIVSRLRAFRLNHLV
jgi:hypothetical protein